MIVGGENVGTDDENLASTEQATIDESVATEVEQTNNESKDWRAEAKALAGQVAELKDQAIRAQAEVQNTRRRAEQDVEKAHKFALDRFAKELLPIIDSLEKTIEAEQATGHEMSALREGVEMTLSMFLSSIKKFNLEPIDPVGHPFDPALHEAMMMVDAPDAEPNTVISVMQKGYTLSGRLARPAMVIVAKAATNVDPKA